MPHKAITDFVQSPDMPDLTEFITTEEAAARLGFNIQSVRHLMRTNKLQGRKVGRTWLVLIQSLEEYIQDTTGLNKHDPNKFKK